MEISSDWHNERQKQISYRAVIYGRRKWHDKENLPLKMGAGKATGYNPSSPHATTSNISAPDSTRFFSAALREYKRRTSKPTLNIQPDKKPR
jgi:hypothetical protein